MYVDTALSYLDPGVTKPFAQSACDEYYTDFAQFRYTCLLVILEVFSTEVNSLSLVFSWRRRSAAVVLQCA